MIKMLISPFSNLQEKGKIVLINQFALDDTSYKIDILKKESIDCHKIKELVYYYDEDTKMFLCCDVIKEKQKYTMNFFLGEDYKKALIIEKSDKDTEKFIDDMLEKTNYFENIISNDLEWMGNKYTLDVDNNNYYLVNNDYEVKEVSNLYIAEFISKYDNKWLNNSILNVIKYNAFTNSYNESDNILTFYNKNCGYLSCYDYCEKYNNDPSYFSICDFKNLFPFFGDKYVAIKCKDALSFVNYNDGIAYKDWSIFIKKISGEKIYGKIDNDCLVFCSKEPVYEFSKIMACEITNYLKIRLVELNDFFTISCHNFKNEGYIDRENLEKKIYYSEENYYNSKRSTEAIENSKKEIDDLNKSLAYQKKSNHELLLKNDVLEKKANDYQLKYYNLTEKNKKLNDEIKKLEGDVKSRDFYRNFTGFFDFNNMIKLYANYDSIFFPKEYDIDGHFYEKSGKNMTGRRYYMNYGNITANDFYHSSYGYDYNRIDSLFINYYFGTYKYVFDFNSPFDTMNILLCGCGYLREIGRFIECLNKKNIKNVNFLCLDLVFWPSNYLDEVKRIANESDINITIWFYKCDFYNEIIRNSDFYSKFDVAYFSRCILEGEDINGCTINKAIKMFNALGNVQILLSQVATYENENAFLFLKKLVIALKKENYYVGVYHASENGKSIICMSNVDDDSWINRNWIYRNGINYYLFDICMTYDF